VWFFFSYENLTPSKYIFCLTLVKIYGESTNFYGSNATPENKTEPKVQQQTGYIARTANWIKEDQIINP